MHILIAIDGSPQAETVLSLGTYLAQSGLTRRPPVLLTIARHDRDRAQAECCLSAARQRLSLNGVEGKVRVGRPDYEILLEAQEQRYDMLLIGEGWRPRRLLACAPERLTAARVAERAPCPVLAVLGRSRPLGPERPIRRILLCDSGARSPLNAVGGEAPPVRRFTTRLAEWLGGEEEVTVLHVMSQLSAGPGVRGQQLRAEADELVAGHTPEGELIEQNVRLLDRQGLHPQAKVRHGLVVAEILSEARSGDYDLVIIGAHQETGWQRFLLDDLAHQILLGADRNVLVVH
jgi:nucleotide-binding universal stress UspA family protein